MDKSQVALYALIVVAVAIRLYMKYKKKDQNKIGSESKSASFPNPGKDDDYEPYSKK